MTWAQYLLVLFLVRHALATHVVYEAKVGDRVVLQVKQRFIRNWVRIREDSEVEEVIRYCPGNDGLSDFALCKGFATQDGEPVIPPSNAHVDRDGRLIIDPVKEEDSGLYLAADEIPRPREPGDNVYETTKTLITLNVTK